MLRKFNTENFQSVNNPLIQNSKLMKEDGAKKIDENVYRSLVGCLLYLISTRPDLMVAVNMLSRFRQEPNEIHFQAAKRVLRFIKGTEEFVISLKKSKTLF